MKSFAAVMLGWLVCLPALATPKFTSIPDWVAPATLPDLNSEKPQTHENGIRYVLVDRQWKIQGTDSVYFSQFASQAVNSAGLSSVSHIEIDFDPDYQTVEFHEISVFRDGQWIDKRSASRIDVLQREEGLADQIYDGTKTVNVFISDVRANDLVRYSFSRIGSNPVFDGHFSTELDLAWGVSLDKLHYRLLNLSGHTLQFKTLGDSTHRLRASNKNPREFVLTLKDVSAIQVDDGYPSDVVPYPYIQVSDYANWAEVVNWALPHYQASYDHPQINATASQLFAGLRNDEEKILAALDFVQEQIRYLGVETGINSHRPYEPAKVLKQRYGDCKDKALLLVSLLATQNIDSHVALVDTQQGKRLPTLLPSHANFNHAIVTLRHDDKRYWLDATRQHQQGNLDNLYQANLSHGLILAAGESQLTPFEATLKGRKEVTEIIDIRDSVNGMQYQIDTLHQAMFADQQRRQRQQQSLQAAQQDYLEFTQKYYPEIQLAADLTEQDDPELNQILTRESYFLASPWQPDDESGREVIQFEPFLMDDHLSVPSKAERDVPMALTHPLELVQTTRILLDDVSGMETVDEHIDDPAFEFHKIVRHDTDRETGADVLVIQYRYKSKQDRVSVEAYPEYRARMDKAYDSGFYQISQRQSSAPVTKTTMQKKAPDHAQPAAILPNQNWLFWLLAVLAIQCAWWFNKGFTGLFETDDAPGVQQQPSLSAGLSVLSLLLGLVIVGYVLHFWLDAHWLAYDHWVDFQRVTTQHEQTFAGIKWTANIFLFSLAVCVWRLLLQRREVFVPAFNAFAVCSTVVALLLWCQVYWQSNQIPGWSHVNSVFVIVIVGLASVIAVYLQRSKRVKQILVM